MALACLSYEPWLDVELVDVQPAPNASRLAVTLRAPSDWTAAALLEELEKVQGYLRAEVAGAIDRKRAPTLIFRVQLTEGEP